MKQTLHIFRKDVRRLRWEILGALALMAVYAWTQLHPWVFLEEGFQQLKLSPLVINLSPLVVLGWWYLIAMLVQQEPLAGDRQFWVTRPYSWKSLLAAKALFIATFISLPALLAQCAILRAAGFSPAAHAAELLVRQGLLVAIFLLPAAALAAITRGFVHFALAGLMFVLYWLIVFYLRISTPGWLILYRGFALLLVSAALAVLFLQYRRRRTTASIGVLACTGILILLLLSPLAGNLAAAWTYPIPKSVAGGSTVSLDFDPSRKYGEGENVVVKVPNVAAINIPLRLSGLPEGTTIESDGVRMSIEAPGGRSWRPSSWNGALFPDNGRPPYITTPISKSEGLVFAGFYVDRQFFEQVKSNPVTLHISLALTLASEQSSSAQLLAYQPFAISNMGLCFFEKGESFDSYFLKCRSAFHRPPQTWIRAEPSSLCVSSQGVPPPENRRVTSGVLSEWAGPWQEGHLWSLERETSFLSPVRVFYLSLPTADFDWSGGQAHGWPCAGTQIILTTRNPVAYFRREIEIHDLRLADYAIR